MWNFKLFALASLVALGSSSTQRRSSDGDLKPWEVTRLSTFSPSGRPGNSNLANLWATITNPSPITAGPGASFEPSTANCTVEWTWYVEEPYGRTVDCTTGGNQTAFSGSISKWTIEILKADSDYASPTENFDVKFTLTANKTANGEDYYKVLAGTQHFAIGENMKGTCGGSGVCSWYLDEKNIPVLVEPTLVDSS
ncbi:uncharacterized protein F4812DRAFT_85511 [Daldinia caldariorum]|uniref:uncharacterized protein n=1 Tax=Daldinia caldariorum TaxID=326644 RepID=UPI002007C3AA|nr:uncharacterized protein F4812DRAFT_85511 [Daldinia caldariorum]KAI1466582.1 hypothetical protein F4812DRAFT_85511 [Daldinia caldariorum]